MESLPCMPGNTFNDPTKERFHVSQSLSFNKGYHVAKAYPHRGIGGDRIVPPQLTEDDLNELANYHPILTYGNAKQEAPKAFVPSYVSLDKKVLRFFGYFKETVHESQIETYRVRYITLYYYLVDDTICISEPQRTNSGIPQGNLIKRQRLPKDEIGNFYDWRDLNVSINLPVYGRIYRLTGCDKYTVDFLDSEGILLNSSEEDPTDPYLNERKQREVLQTYKSPSSYDARRQFLENDRKVLRFYAVWDDRTEMFGDCRHFCIHYYLADDTMEVVEIRAQNDGYDPFPTFVKRSKIPRTLDLVPKNFPTVSMELSEREVKEYFKPCDLQIGATVVILGRKMLIHRCDNFTKAWYNQNFGMTDFTPIDVSIPQELWPKMEIPPYNGFGTLDDSLMQFKSCLPKPPKRDFTKLVDYGTKSLRFSCTLDSPYAEDAQRRFILSYKLADDTIVVQELQVRNSGFPGQRFLASQRVVKPGSCKENPDYYGPADFKLGCKIHVFGSRFTITGIDEYAVKFMEENLEQFPQEMVCEWRQHLSQQKDNSDRFPVEEDATNDDGSEVDNAVRLIEKTIHKMYLTGSNKCLNCYRNLERHSEQPGKITELALARFMNDASLKVSKRVISAFLAKHGSMGYVNLGQFKRFLAEQH